MDAAVVFPELVLIFTLKEEQRRPLLDFLVGEDQILYTQVDLARHLANNTLRPVMSRHVAPIVREMWRHLWS